MNGIRVQGVVFGTVALVVSGVSFFVTQGSSIRQLIILALMVFMLGVPHGALDPLFAIKLLRIRDKKGWFKFVLLYTALVLFIIDLWLLWPLFFMFCFLTMSALHFSRDLTLSTPLIIKVLYGGAVIVLPNLLHRLKMIHLFSTILEPASAEMVTSTLHVLAIPWALLLTLTIYSQFKRDKVQALEILALTLMAVCADPLITFTTYFCLMHSLRHILRTHRFLSVSWTKMLATAAWPMATVGAVVWMYLRWIPTESEYSYTMQLVFVGLAALTLPHMLLIDQVRYSA